jgi:integrase
MAASTVLSANRDILGKKAGSKNSGKSALSERPAQPPTKCPKCHSSKVWKDGLRYVHSETRTISIQRFVCSQCGRRFSETSLKGSDPPEHVESVHTNKSYTPSAHTLPRQVCVAETLGAKNLVQVESRIEKRAERGATTQAEIKGKLIEYMWKLKRQGYAESTINTYTNVLRFLTRRGADLYTPENVKYVIAVQETWSRGRRRNAVKAYDLFLKMEGLTWEKPKYKPIDKLPFIPTEKEIDELIAGSSEQMSTYLQFLKETGARRGEAFNVTWTDIDFVTDTVRITPEKGSNARIFKISDKLKSMLQNLPKNSGKVWIYKNVHYLSKGFRRMRKKIAHKLGNPRILRIHFHTLRHWKATTEYARTKDILYVKQLLGHRSINTTLKYVQLVSLPHEEKFICKVATKPDEAVELIEAGFEYVTGEYDDGGKLFRKRKVTYLGSPSIPVGSWSSLV